MPSMRCLRLSASEKSQNRPAGPVDRTGPAGYEPAHMPRAGDRPAVLPISCFQLRKRAKGRTAKTRRASSCPATGGRRFPRDESRPRPASPGFRDDHLHLFAIEKNMSGKPLLPRNGQGFLALRDGSARGTVGETRHESAGASRRRPGSFGQGGDHGPTLRDIVFIFSRLRKRAKGPRASETLEPARTAARNRGARLCRVDCTFSQLRKHVGCP